MIRCNTQANDMATIAKKLEDTWHIGLGASHKEECAAMEKGKWSTNLSSYAHLNAQELHSGFLNRLYSNRDYEAGLVNLMKERYEVSTNPLLS